MSKPWVHSFSALELYQLCPLKFQHEKILKTVPFVESEQVKWGNDVHRALEKAVKDGAALEQRYEMFQYVVESILRRKALRYPEMKLGVNRELQNTGFFDTDVYVRGVADIVLADGDKLFAGDYKTGKKKAGSKQLTLMALLLFAKFPAVQEIFTAFIWLQNKSITSEVYRREQVAELWEPFLEAFKELEWAIENNTFHARENFLCKAWCQVHSCVFNGRNGK